MPDAIPRNNKANQIYQNKIDELKIQNNKHLSNIKFARRVFIYSLVTVGFLLANKLFNNNSSENLPDGIILETFKKISLYGCIIVIERSIFNGLIESKNVMKNNREIKKLEMLQEIANNKY